MVSRAELGRGAGKGRRSTGATGAREVLWRYFALLLQIYEEVSAAGRFLFRRSPPLPTIHKHQTAAAAPNQGLARP